MLKKLIFLFVLLRLVSISEWCGFFLFLLWNILILCEDYRLWIFLVILKWKWLNGILGNVKGIDCVIKFGGEWKLRKDRI